MSEFESQYDDEIDLFELFQTLWSGKWWILFFTLISGGGSAWVSLQLPNIYLVEAKIAAVGDGDASQMSQLVAQYGGLASLAGVSLPSSASGSMTGLLLEIMRSRAFVGDFIESNGLGPRLFAVESFDPLTQTERYDSAIYDPTSRLWTREVEAPQTKEPSRQELYKAFSEGLVISEDKKSPVVTVSFEHPSPVLGYEIVTGLVNALDDYARARDKSRSQQSIAYLEEKLRQTRLVEVEKVLYQMIETQTKTLMLAEVNPDYAFQVVDPAVIPELKAKPKRALIVAISVLAGGMVGILFVLIRAAVRNRFNRES